MTLSKPVEDSLREAQKHLQDALEDLVVLLLIEVLLMLKN